MEAPTFCSVLHAAFKVVSSRGFTYFGNAQLKSPIGILLSSWLCMLHGLNLNACHLELAGILMLENVNKIQHFEAFYISEHETAC